MNGRLKRMIIWPLRIVLAAAALLSFFGWVPLLDSEPLSALPADRTPAAGIPSWAKSFHVNHGEVVFNSFGTPKQDPVAFGGLVFVTLGTLGGLVWSFPKEQRRRFIRRRFGMPE